MGVKPFYKRFERDGVRSPNIALVFSDRGQGCRAPEVDYDRGDEAAAMLKPGDFDWTGLLKNARWFHSGGIYAALSDTTAPLIIEAMTAAKANGCVVSYDLNARPKLWQPRGGMKKAVEVNREIVRLVDVLVGNEEDLQEGLGVAGPDVKKESDLDPKVFLEMINGVVKDFPNIKVMATTLRQVHSVNRHTWSAVAWIDGQTFQAPVIDIDVLDRVGGGDGFAAGLFYGLLEGLVPQMAVNLGWAHGALVATTPGDTTMATLNQVKALAIGGSARIQR
jgi:2-dehydro-3-deoxygluconokinase